MPERISDNWVAVISIASGSRATAGSWNVPGDSSRLYQIASPSQSQ